VAEAGAARRPALRRLPWAVAAGVGTFAGVAVAVAAARKAEVTDRSPIRPPDGWRPVYVAALACAFALYLLGLLLLSRRSATLSAVLVVAVAIQLAPLAAPLLLSTDGYSYWDYGRIAAVHGGNPYKDRPSRWPSDPAYRRMGKDWQERTSVYGPAFTLVAEGHARVADDSPASASFGFRALAAAAMLGLVAAATLAARGSPFAAAFVGWNPLLALHFAGGGHNDVLMMALAAGALALGAAGRSRLGGAAWALAASVKAVALVFLPLHALEAHKRGRSVRGLAIGFGVAAAVIAAVAFIRYGSHWLGVIGPLVNQNSRASSLGLPYWLAKWGVPQEAARDAVGVLFALLYAWLLREAWRGRARLGLCAAGLLLATPWLQPWYAVWAVPLAAVEEDRLARLAVLALSAFLLRDALPL
jgi:alpha-1,6-mannosyltransferase